MAYKQITPCLGGASFDADFGSIPGINNGDILYLTFTNSLYDGCYTVDTTVFTFTETVITTSLAYIDCPTCLAAITTPTPTPTPTTTPCPCNEFLVTISSTDTDDATGNTGGLSIYNGVVVWEYTDCTTGLLTEELLSTGTYSRCACGFGSSLTYFKNNLESATVASSAAVQGPCALSPTPTPTPTPSTSSTSSPIWYQIFDCDDSSVGYSIAYTAGSFSINERCTAVNVSTRTVIIIGSTGTLPGGPLYTLTSLGTTGCPSSPGSSPTQTPTPTITPSADGCVCYQYTNDGDPGGVNSITYLDCNHISQSITNIAFGNSGYFCAIIGTPNESAGLTVIQVSETFCGGCIEGITPTPTQSPTETPTQTPTNTQTPTQTNTQTPTQTNTQTPTPSTTATAGLTPTATETQTPTPTVTSTNTPSNTPTQTPTNSSTSTPTQTQTQTPTNTATNTETPTNTPTQTPTQTPTITPTAGYLVELVDCTNSSNIFRFFNVGTTLTLGAVYYITGGVEFEGCATVVPLTGAGPLYNGLGVSFTQTASGCADAICPKVSTVPALLYKCSDSAVFYATVKEDTAFVGAVYLYSGECYNFVEFSGPGGPDLGDPDFADCKSCSPTPTPTATPQSTPTNTPTVSVTPSACTFTEFCFYTTLPSFSGYNGNYGIAGTYNSRLYYSGDGVSYAVVYYTGNYWCLSTSLGGSCLLRGAYPCNSLCPDISVNDFDGGICPTPTPTPINCSTFDFNAYFDCDWEPLPTPTPSVACDDVNFDIESIGVTPTPTPSGNFCTGVAINFSISGYTPVTPTVTLTPSVTLTRTVSLGGLVTFEMMDETFSCVSVKVLTDCQSGEEFYTTDSLSFSGTPVIIGMTMFVQVNGVERCVIYSRDDKNFSSNSSLGNIVQIYSSCEYCSTIPTPTPTVTNTPTITPSPTSSITPSATPTQTATPSQTATIGSTPPPTPSQTRTATATNTPTPSITASPSATPTYVYVYQSCSPLGKNLIPTQVIQTQRVTFVTETNVTFKDSNNDCWFYVGRFDSTYIAPPTVTDITYNGNFFDGSPSQTYPDCATCQTQPLELCLTYQYFNATRCDNGQGIVVKSCYIEPTPITFNTFQFGFSGSFTQQLDLNVKVGEFAVVADPTGDFCISVVSSTTQQNTNFIASSLAFSPISNCSSCPVYRTYVANTCDGTQQNITILDLASAPQLAIGTIASVGNSTTCYVITAYNGILTNLFTSPSFSNFVAASYTDCQSCIDSFNTSGGGGGGGEFGGGGGGS